MLVLFSKKIEVLKMKSLQEFNQFVLNELKDKCSITEDQIGHLGMAQVDLMENHFEFDFSVRNRDGKFVFWHDYAHNVGRLIVIDENEKEEILEFWGDWDNYGLPE